jgi:hypothetical protein
MSELAAYGHRKQAHWIQCKVFCKLAVVIVVGLFAFFSLLGAVYLPYLDAVQMRTESYLQAEQYVKSPVCSDPKILQTLGRFGQEDCARFARTLTLDIPSEASRDVLRKYNLCKDGDCIILSFNLVTLLTTFLPLCLVTCAAFFLLIVGYILYGAYMSAQANNELPVMLTNLMVQQLASQYTRHPHDTPQWSKSHAD